MFRSLHTKNFRTRSILCGFTTKSDNFEIQKKQNIAPLENYWSYVTEMDDSLKTSISFPHKNKYLIDASMFLRQSNALLETFPIMR